MIPCIQAAQLMHLNNHNNEFYQNFSGLYPKSHDKQIRAGANFENNVSYNNTLNSTVQSKAVEEAQNRKGIVITFYKNCEPFSSGFRVSLMPGRNFKSLEHLCDYLTEKTKVQHGCRFIFTLNGERIYSLNEFVNGQSYVVSGVKQFQYHPYGQSDKLKQNGALLSSLAATKSRAAKVGLFREEDLKLLRPLSTKFEPFFVSNPKHPPPYKDGRIIVVINNKDHALRTKVLLNLRTPKPFEVVLRDLGQSVNIKNAKRMFTASGQEVSAY